MEELAARDPYADKRAASERLANEFAIEDEDAFRLLLDRGSEMAARKALQQRWWRGEVERRERS